LTDAPSKSGDPATRRAGFQQTLVFAIVAGLFVATAQFAFFSEVKRPEADALRYIDYALNLYHHGVFGLSDGALSEAPSPGNANSPLYPAWLALWMTLDPGLSESLSCVRFQPPGTPCPLDLDRLLAAQSGLAVLAFTFLWLTARRLHGRAGVAWLAGLAAFLSFELLKFANLVLTEILVLPLFFAFVWCLVVAYQTGKLRWWLAAGLAIGLTALTRPEYAYLFYGLALALGAATLWRRQKLLLFKGAMLVLGFGLVAAPWLGRNYVQFGQASLTGGYADAIFAQRAAYNRMSWPEIGVAFVYWLPDFGDSLAGKLFPKPLHAKLGWQEGSYYLSESPKVFLESRNRVENREDVLADLMHEHVQKDPAKHFFVTLALLARGMFVAKYWGILGLIGFLLTLCWSLKKRDQDFLIASLPAWFMAVFYAAVSVSVARYNLGLLQIYAIGIAWTAYEAGSRLRWLRRGPPGKADETR